MLVLTSLTLVCVVWLLAFWQLADVMSPVLRARLPSCGEPEMDAPSPIEWQPQDLVEAVMNPQPVPPKWQPFQVEEWRALRESWGLKKPGTMFNYLPGDSPEEELLRLQAALPDVDGVPVLWGYEPFTGDPTPLQQQDVNGVPILFWGRDPLSGKLIVTPSAGLK